MVFCSGHCLLQRDVSLVRVKSILICGPKDPYLECRYELFWVSEVVVVGSSP